MTVAVELSIGENKYLSEYAEGWINMNAQEILKACAPGYTFIDPEGQVSREEFPAYLEGFKGKAGATAMSIQAVGVDRIAGKLVVACYWEAGAAMGSGLIVVGPAGVERETVALR